MDVLAFVMRIIGFFIRTLILVLWVLLKWGFKKAFFKRPAKLPTGEKIIAYADGRSMIELEHEHGKTRYVPDTPEMRARIARHHAERRRHIFRRRPRAQ